MKSSGAAETTTSAAEGLLFLRRWLAHPLKVGAVLPSSPALGRLVARHVRRAADQAVVELGAGTGAVTKRLLRAGVPADRLFVVEIDPDMCAFLRRQLPQVQVVLGDATRLPDLLPRQWHGKVGTVISGIPMVPLPIEVQRRLVEASFAVMAPGGNILQYTYSLVSPILQDKVGVRGSRSGVAMLNVPPASVWSYQKAA